jgi:hypothetical protein
MSIVAELLVFQMVSVRTLRCVLAAGEATIVVVVADAICVLVRPGVMTAEASSTQDA